MVNLRINAAGPVAKMARATATITAMTGPAGAALEDLSVLGGSATVQLAADGTATVPLAKETGEGDPIIYQVTVGRVTRHLDLSDAADDATVDWGNPAFLVLDPPAPTDWVPVTGVVAVDGTAADADLASYDAETRTVTVDLPDASQVPIDLSGIGITATQTEAAIAELAAGLTGYTDQAVAAEQADRVSGDAATLAAAQAAIDAIDDDRRWIDAVATTGRLVENFVRLPAGNITADTYADVLRLTLLSGGGGGGTINKPTSVPRIVLGATTVDAGASVFGAASLGSGLLVGPDSGFVADCVAAGSTTGLGNDYNAVFAMGSALFVIGAHPSDANLLRVKLWDGSALDDDVADITPGEFQHFRLVGTGSAVVQWWLNGVQVHETAVAGFAGPVGVSCHISKAAGSTVRSMTIQHVAVTWGRQ